MTQSKPLSVCPRCGLVMRIEIMAHRGFPVCRLTCPGPACPVSVLGPDLEAAEETLARLYNADSRAAKGP